MSRSHLRVVVAATLLAASAGSLSAQNLVDPSDRIYRHLAIWEQKRYIDALPPLRPYPLRLVRGALRQVETLGAAADRALATDYLGHLTGLPLAAFDGAEGPAVDVAAFTGLTGKGDSFGANFGARVRSTGAVGESFDYSGSFAYWWDSAFGKDTGFRYVPPEQPTFASAGPNLPLGSEVFRGLEDVRLSASFGSGTVYVRGGFSRQAFGPFLGDGVVIGEQSPATAQLSFVAAGRSLTYTAALFDLVARFAVRTTGELYDLKSEPPATGFPSKYFALHSLEWRPLRWLTIGGVQGSLFGGRLSLYSILPTAFITEPFAGDYDNAFAGISGQVALPWNLKATLMFHVDDYQLFDPEAGFEPSPFANKVAAQTGLSWVAAALPAVVSVDYAFVAPYMYTHSSHQPINYLTYTHRGESFGSALPPNSDRFTISAFATPLSWLDVSGNLRFARHGNGSDHGAGSVDGDGSIWDDGYTSDGGVTFFGESTFLSQGVLEQVFQADIAASVRLPVDSLSAQLTVQYGLEHITNRDLDASASMVLNHVFAVSAQIGL